MPSKIKQVISNKSNTVLYDSVMRTSIWTQLHYQPKRNAENNDFRENKE